MICSFICSYLLYFFSCIAPTDDAFNGLVPGTVEALLDDIPLLTSILTYHVLDTEVFSADLVSGEVVTLNGESVTVDVSNDVIMINDATVIIPNVEACNGVIHVIDTVLIPPSSGGGGDGDDDGYPPPGGGISGGDDDYTSPPKKPHNGGWHSSSTSSSSSDHHNGKWHSKSGKSKSSKSWHGHWSKSNKSSKSHGHWSGDGWWSKSNKSSKKSHSKASWSKASSHHSKPSWSGDGW